MSFEVEEASKSFEVEEASKSFEVEVNDSLIDEGSASFTEDEAIALFKICVNALRMTASSAGKEAKKEKKAAGGFWTASWQRICRAVAWSAGCDASTRWRRR